MGIKSVYKLKNFHFLITVFLVFLLLVIGIILLPTTNFNFGWPTVIVLLLPMAVILWYFFFVAHPKFGIYVLLFELILGGNGRWFELLGGVITPRYILIISVILGYLFIIFMRRGHIPRVLLPFPLMLFGLILALGVLEGFWERNQDFFQDAQVWLYLILALVIIDFWRRTGFPANLFRLFFICTTGIAIIQLILTLVVNINQEVVFSHYTTLERMRILISPLAGTSIYYTFMGNSPLYSFVFAIGILLVVVKRPKVRLFKPILLWLMAIITLFGAIFSMTRGTWGQITITFLLVATDLLIRKKFPIKAIIVITLLGMIIGGVILSNQTWKDAFLNRALTLLPSSRESLDPMDSVIIKAKETNQLINALQERPIFGYGFGLGDYQDYGYLLQNAIYFHNSYLQFFLKTGLLGITALLFVIFSQLWITWHVGQLVRREFPELRAILHGMIYGLVGILIATTSNPHLTTPAFVSSLALMVAATNIVYRNHLKVNLVHDNSI